MFNDGRITVNPQIFTPVHAIPGYVTVFVLEMVEEGGDGDVFFARVMGAFHWFFGFVLGANGGEVFAG